MYACVCVCVHTCVCCCVYDVHVCLVLSFDKCMHVCIHVHVCRFVCALLQYLFACGQCFFTSRMQIIHNIYLFMAAYVYDYHSLVVCIIIIKIVITVLYTGLQKKTPGRSPKLGAIVGETRSKPVAHQANHYKLKKKRREIFFNQS